ncbi:MAG TPA: PhzF family phenazine biosynthesis protein [Beijerinckiaceae bacterium]|nr:PhzF family phenazine biosynthesis protein [Beijerinckiaceae bacterium]
MRRKFYTLDVFTDVALSGNPLAVVLDADGLQPARMQAIAREFNLSETVFVLTPRDPVNTARLRIFTPDAELPFAGHPTIGAAILIAQLRASDLLAREEIALVLEEEIGLLACSVRQAKGRAAQASFVAPRLPESLEQTFSPERLAAAVSLRPADIGFDSHCPSRWSAGVDFTFVPVRSREAMGRTRPNLAEWPSGPAGSLNACLYTKEARGEGIHVRARVFAPTLGVWEDPATGSAAVAFAGVAAAFEQPEDGEHVLLIEQGEEMGRPSLITLQMRIAGGRLAGVAVSGSAVRILDGFIEV